MKPGIYQLSMAEYLALPYLSSGLCHTILSESPAHAKFQQEYKREASTEMDVGTYAHALLLEGGADNLQVIDALDWRTKNARELRDAARLEGKLPILAYKLPEVKAMVTAARAYVDGGEICHVFSRGEPEVTLIFEVDGMLCKARADWLTGDRSICLSYKTTAGTANPESWIRTQLPSYDVATVFYERAVLEACPEITSTRCVHLVQEQSEPWACSLVALSPALAQIAEQKLRRAMEIWARCLKTGKFPAYPPRICYAEPTPWQMAEAEQSMLTDQELEGGIPA